MITEAEIDKALAYLRDNAERDAQARAQRLYLEQWIKTVLSQVQSMSSATSVAASEIEARCSEQYQSALETYRTSIENDEKARFLPETLPFGLDLGKVVGFLHRHQGASRAVNDFSPAEKPKCYENAAFLQP